MRTVLDLFTALPGLLAGHPFLAGFTVFTFGGGLVLLVVALLRATGGVPARPASPAAARRAAEAAEDRARELRIRADDAVRSAVWGPARPTTFDERTAVLVVDPTLRAADVAEMVEHITPGEGSVASVVAEPTDTRLRTVEMQARFEADWDAAVAEAPIRDAEAETRRLFAGFDGRLAVALAQFRTAPAIRRADAWAHYEHGERDVCPRCAAAAAEVSGEYRAIVERVERETTRSWSVAELREILAPA